MVQKKLTANFKQTRTPLRASEKRKLVKSVKDLRDPENVTDLNYEDADPNSLELVRKALDTSSPQSLPGREAQIERVYGFLSSRLADKKPGSLYISGAPGTGKTAVVRFTLDKIAEERKAGGKKSSPGFYQIFVNCMCKRSAKEIYEVILDAPPKTKGGKGSLKDKVEEKLLLKPKSQMIVLVLDEMDQILQEKSGSNEVLYSLFEWARSPDYRLILIGIANALDLTVRHLPFLNLNSSPVKQARGAPQVDEFQCQTMNFPPYQRDDIEKIIQERMEQLGQSIFNAAAIKFVAGKVAASTGDARKALHACKEALVTVEKQEQRSVLQETDENASATPSFGSPPKRTCVRNDQIGIVAVSKALQVKKDDGPLPLQQTTILAALLMLFRSAPNMRDPLVDGVNKPIPMTTLYREYRKLCSLKGFAWIEESELPLVCEVLQDRSLLSIVNSGGGKKLSVGNKKFGSPSSASNNKIGVFFDPRATEALVLQGDTKQMFE